MSGIVVNQPSPQTVQVWDSIKASLDFIHSLSQGNVDIDTSTKNTKIITWCKDIYNATNVDPFAADYFYQQLKKYSDEYLNFNVVEAAHRIYKTQDASELFSFMVKSYKAYMIAVKEIKTIFRYLDQYFTKRKGVDDVAQMLIKSFRSAVYREVKGRFLDYIIILINKYRNGEITDTVEICTGVSFFVVIGELGGKKKNFLKDFFLPFIHETEKYYSKISEDYINLVKKGQKTTLDYINYALEKINFEDNLIEKINFNQHDSFSSEIKRNVYEKMITNHLDFLLRDEMNGFESFFLQNRIPELKLFFNVAEKIPSNMGINKLSEMIIDFVVKHGDELLSTALFSLTTSSMARNEAGRRISISSSRRGSDHSAVASAAPITSGGGAQPVETVDSRRKTIMYNFLSFVKEKRAIVEGELRHVDLVRAYSTGIKGCVNDPTQLMPFVADGVQQPLNTLLPRADAFPGQLAKFADDLIRRAVPGVSRLEELAEWIGHVLYAFDCISNKEMFLRDYKFSLSTRLLWLRPGSTLDKDDYAVERDAISRLQILEGENVRSLRVMLEDAGTERVAGFAAARPEFFKGNKALEYSVRVINGVHWPQIDPIPIREPPSLRGFIAEFNKYFAAAHPLKSLTWLHSHARGVLTVHFRRGDKEVTAGAVQAIALLYIDEAPPKEGITAAKLAAKMGIDPELCRLVIASLFLDPNYKLIDTVDGGSGSGGISSGRTPSGYYAPGFKASDAFRINLEYTNKQRTFRLPPIRPSNTPFSTSADESGNLTSSAAKAENIMEVKHAMIVKCAIVRLVKAKESFKVEKLFTAIKEQMARKFILTQTLFKNVLEDLISAEILQRDDSDPFIVNFLA